MWTPFKFALAALLACLTASACAPPAPAPSPGEPALWRIADADSEIWLFGGVHVLPPELRWRGPRFEATFARAEELVTETDIEATQQVYGELVARYGRLENGAALNDLLTPQEQARFAGLARGLNLDPSQFASARPWLAAAQLSLAYALAHGHTQAAGVENVLVPEARAAGKRLSYLETAEQQVRTLASLSPADEVRFLLATLDELEQGEVSLNTANQAWARGDVAALAAALDDDLNEAGPAVHEALIAGRNRAWAAEIKRRLAGDGRIFYAVGAAHLAGADSVVALLRADGVVVEGP